MSARAEIISRIIPLEREFYLAYGFTLIGFNACEYQNTDLQRKEVRMEMGMLLSCDDK